MPLSQTMFLQLQSTFANVFFGSSNKAGQNPTMSLLGCQVWEQEACLQLSSHTINWRMAYKILFSLERVFVFTKNMVLHSPSCLNMSIFAKENMSEILTSRIIFLSDKSDRPGSKWNPTMEASNFYTLPGGVGQTSQKHALRTGRRRISGTHHGKRRYLDFGQCQQLCPDTP